jgi:photosynthetic reaction center H subunit
MQFGAFTPYIDVAQIALYIFWFFFAGLILYLRQEDRREGYPLESDPEGRTSPHAFLWLPKPKRFDLLHGGSVFAPREEKDPRPIKARRLAPWPGAPLEPTGDPMADAVGPASYALRAETPDLTAEGHVKIVPMRDAAAFSVADEDPDPRGKAVIAADGAVAGTVTDIWVDRSEMMVRYYEVALPVEGRRKPASVLLPYGFTRVGGDGTLKVGAILASQFAGVPKTAAPDRITLREEDRIMAYYAGGTLYATRERQEPLA